MIILTSLKLSKHYWSQKCRNFLCTNSGSYYTFFQLTKQNVANPLSVHMSVLCVTVSRFCPFPGFVCGLGLSLPRKFNLSVRPSCPSNFHPCHGFVRGLDLFVHRKFSLSVCSSSVSCFCPCPGFVCGQDLSVPRKFSLSFCPFRPSHFRMSPGIVHGLVLPPKIFVQLSMFWIPPPPHPLSIISSQTTLTKRRSYTGFDM